MQGVICHFHCYFREIYKAIEGPKHGSSWQAPSFQMSQTIGNLAPTMDVSRVTDATHKHLLPLLFPVS